MNVQLHTRVLWEFVFQMLTDMKTYFRIIFGLLPENRVRAPGALIEIIFTELVSGSGKTPPSLLPERGSD